MQHGGQRAGAGRPKGSGKYKEATTTLRIPISKTAEVRAYLQKKGMQEGIPLYLSTVRAGFPSPADDYIEAYLDLHQHLIKNPASTFFLIAAGDSMIDADIKPGDMLIVDKSIEPAHGKIVIAAVDGELTVKRIAKLNQQILLLPANDAYKPIDITECHDVVIWGVVTHIIHQAK